MTESNKSGWLAPKKNDPEKNIALDKLAKSMAYSNAVRFNCMIPLALYNEFKSKVYGSGHQMSEIIIGFIKEYMDK